MENKANHKGSSYECLILINSEKEIKREDCLSIVLLQHYQENARLVKSRSDATMFTLSYTIPRISVAFSVFLLIFSFFPGGG